MVNDVENAILFAIISGWRVWGAIAGLMVISELGRILHFIVSILVGA